MVGKILIWWIDFFEQHLLLLFIDPLGVKTESHYFYNESNMVSTNNIN